MDQRTPGEWAEIEAFRDRIRRLPGVIVHRPVKQIPYVPDVAIVGPITLDELLGYEEDDEDASGEEQTGL